MRCNDCTHYDVCYQYDIIGEDDNEMCALYEQKRKHGEWIPCKSTRIGQVTNIDYKCSECSHHKDRPVPYCEICGAIMKKKEGDEK